ncbi:MULTISPECIES: tail fiber domain-containing protein [unclassified Citrobacter]|uniref:tail fiber domain-containing protein n=2 Tax=Citrobacter TaxID=544 RepID=UPI0015EAA8FE|nr:MULTISPECIES: tail fiber domain-containing protein [unclassified Citrobacter]MBA7873224.1 tail fiber domain-containing protein [Citrobacter sp. RHBSTW-00827]QLS95076.1 tail fiber domain-containing protein [Citrobacter sp. RHBSTW-00859]QLT54458.1 tail fiber domain-containing protein [Citrobacter sp. RHBSTW-00821]QLU30738.1 tail fiber domain-containing protein [Citrobacter sp. RHBSTW-00446]QLZ78771.1 tail fiber domain-containing protein [Citrobacter sp. RHBSTW-00107]
MSAGTLTLNNNSASVAGTDTTFTTELAAGDFVVVTVGGITYTLPVKTIDSDTQITLISKYPGPSQASSAWNAVPRATQNQVTAALVAQTTEALRGLNYDKQNWQMVFSTGGDITVMLPDGSQFSGPSWKKITDLLKEIDPDHLQSLADQISADAGQVAVDKTAAAASASTASTAASTATTKAGEAATSASTATTKAGEAATSASTATTKAGEAATSAQQAHDTAAALGNLSDFSQCIASVNTATFAISMKGDISAPTTVITEATPAIKAAPFNIKHIYSGSRVFAPAGMATIQKTGGTGSQFTLNMAFGGYIGSAGTADSAGPMLTCSDGAGYTKYWLFVNGSGGINTANGAILPSGSDGRLKKEATAAQTGALDRVSRIESYEFTWRGDGRRDRGVIAQQLQEVDPLYVFKAGGEDPENPILNVSYLALVSDLIGAVKELKAQLDALKK